MRQSNNSFVAHPGTRAGCPECRGRGLVVGREGPLARAELCSCVGTCPRCQGTGFVGDPRDRRAPRRRCVCRVANARIELFNRAHIPARHAGSTRTSFDGKKKGPAVPFLAVANYLKDYQPGSENRGLVLYGRVGRGKTHLMVAVLRELILDHGVSARFVEFSHLIADLKSSFDRGSGAAALLDPLSSVDVLAIDELGKGRVTEWETTVLDELISRRYNAAATILATTNWEPRAATGQAVPSLARPDDAPALVDRVGPRIYSRLEETCDFVPCLGDDYRSHLRRHRRPGRVR